MAEVLDDPLALLEAEMNVVVDFPELVVADRCDRCGAQAFVMTMHVKGLLYWCGHHFNKYREALVSDGDKQKAIAISDHTDRLNAKPSMSANAL